MNRREFLLSASAATPWASAQAAPVRALVGEAPPYAYRTADGQVTGAAFELVADIARRLAVAVTCELEPMARAVMMAQRSGPVLLFPTARLPSREGLFRWVAPLVPMRLRLFAKRDGPGDIRSLDAARRLKLGVLSSGGMREYCESLGLVNIQLVSSNTRAVKMLLADRFDAVLTADHAVRSAIQELGVAPGVLREGAVVMDTHLWVAASLAFQPDEVARWRRGFAEQGTDGTRKRVLERYRIV